MPILIFFVFMVGVLGMLFNAWGVMSKEGERLAEPVRVTVTLFPYYDMARFVGGEHVHVRLLLPPGVDPHEFEPHPNDIALINASDIFVYTNPALECWAERLLEVLPSVRPYVINASSQAVMIANVDRSAECGAHERRTETLDPHVWLDADNAITILHQIRDALIAEDRTHANEYQERSLIYESKLKQLDEQYRNALSSCRTRVFIHGGHRCFGYLARRYNLEYHSVADATGQAALTTNELAGLSILIREKALPYVFYDSFSTPRIAELLAKQTGAGILELDPIANITEPGVNDGTTFTDIMEWNLQQLKFGLDCR